jgi:disulfide bond formation protein DsbB
VTANSKANANAGVGTAARGSSVALLRRVGQHLSPRMVLGLSALLCVAALAAALVSQHVFDMQPCAWCVLQRLVFVLVALAGAAGAALPQAAGRARGAAAWVMLAFALAGVAAALWHQSVAASAASCDLTLADRIMGASGLDMALPQVFAPFASCADAKVDLLGISYPLWSLALYVLLALAAAWAWRHGRRAGA